MQGSFNRSVELTLRPLRKAVRVPDQDCPVSEPHSVNLARDEPYRMQGSFNRSDVVLPDGAFIADLASLQFDLALSPEITLRSLTQYNSTTDSVSTSVRFNWIYRPGSDIYIAYDELRQDDFLGVDPTLRHAGRVPWVQNRQLAIKMAYLLSR